VRLAELHDADVYVPCWWLPQHRHVGVAQYPLLVLLPLGLWNQVLVETTEAQRVTDINIARFETVAQHAVHQKFVFVGVDAPESVRILLVEIRLRALWNERLGDLLEATANQAFRKSIASSRSASWR